MPGSWISHVQALSKHASERCAERGIKNQNIDLCMCKGKRTNATKGRYKYYYRGLSVIATACDGPKTFSAQPSWHYRQGRHRVVTAFWTHGYADGPAAYEQQQAFDRGKREKHCTTKRYQAKAAYEKRSAAYEKQQAFDRVNGKSIARRKGTKSRDQPRGTATTLGSYHGAKKRKENARLLLKGSGKWIRWKMVMMSLGDVS